MWEGSVDAAAFHGGFRQLVGPRPCGRQAQAVTRLRRAPHAGEAQLDWVAPGLRCRRRSALDCGCDRADRWQAARGPRRSELGGTSCGEFA